MGQKTIKVSPELAKTIRARRNELNLTIEEAATKASVGTKTWSRYESGESIRKDKYKGICKALNWRTFPDQEGPDATDRINLDEYKKHEAWSKFLSKEFGKSAAASFAIGSDILLDHLNEDMEALSSMPKGTHVGEVDFSWLEPSLPPQFLMRYDYDFLYIMRCTILRLRAIAHAGNEIIAHSVIEELALYLIVEESEFLMESAEIEDNDDWKDWIFNIFDDMDIITFLYSDFFVERDNIYHFNHWYEQQFYMDR